MRNWRGEKERTTNFNIDAPTFILGANGLGKSRHFNAFCWLLFGKDSEDRKDFNVRSYDEHHNLLHRCECSVEARLIVDGEELTIKREFAEQWTKPRSQVEEVFNGNVTLCTWNGAPIKVTEYQNRVNECIINDTLFKVLTNPKYFTEKMKWQDQREVLLQMAGVKSDEEIAASNEEFKKLLDILSNKSLSDYRKEIAAAKKRLKVELNEIGPRIDQTQKLMPEAEDWTAIENEIKEINEQISSLTAQVQGFASADEAKANEKIAISREIARLMEMLQELKDAQQQDATKQASDVNAEKRNVESKLKTSNSELSTINIDKGRVKERVGYITKQVSEITDQLTKMRQEWYNITAAEYSGSDICPCCGQLLPEEKRLEARRLFSEKKQKDFVSLNARGMQLKGQLEDLNTELAAKESEEATLEKALADKQEEINKLYEQLSSMKEKTTSDFIFGDTEEMIAIQNKIKELGAKRDEVSTQSDNEVLKEIESKRDSLADERKSLEERLQKREQIEKANKEIKRLENLGRDLSQQIADVEQREYIAAQFTKKKIEDCETRINAMFELVKFQLFDYTQDGNEFECCTCLVGGVPYATANSAGQVNAGLDIIRSLCKFNNVCAPIFCDGSESVNSFIEMPSQMIFLKVTDDKRLIVK